MKSNGSGVNSIASAADLHKLFEQALNSGDIDGLVDLYAVDGFLMARSGPARGISAIRKPLAEYVAIEADDPTDDAHSCARGGYRVAYGRLEIPRDDPRWRHSVNLWHQY